MATARAPPPPPVIGKAGSYTVFITPSSITPPSESLRSDIVCPSPSSTARRTETEAPFPAKTPPPSPPPLPPVQVPPPQFEKTAAKSSGSVLGFFWEAVAKVQNAHSSLDEHLANWFGLDHSRYQWALNDYYESSEKVMTPKQQSHDPAWRHARRLENRLHWQCLHCDIIGSGGGVTRLKQHLTGGYPDVSNCSKVSPEVRRAMREEFDGKKH